jgi:nitrogen fixation NifU-like protein
MPSTVYRQIILDHYQHPRHFGPIEKASHTMEHDNPSCGDRLLIQFDVKDNIIENVGFTGTGCALSMAGASLFLDKIKGQKMSTVVKFTKQDMYDLLQIEVSPAREKCALLALETVKKHINQQ